MIKLLALMESLPGMSPGEETLHEGFGKTLDLVKTLQKEAPEELHDSRGIKRRQRQELPFGREHAIRNQGVGVGIPICRISAVRLQRDDAAGPDVVAIQQRLEGLKDGGVSGLRQKAKQLAVALDEAAQGARDGKGPVPVGHGSENLGRELFGKERGALGLTTGAEIPGAT
jgi:hypothetical protein